MTFNILKDQKDINEVVDIHMKAFPKFFLTQLGRGFIHTLYDAYLQDKQSDIIIAKEDDRIVGFLAFSYDYSGFFKRMLKKKKYRFVFYSIKAAFKHPSFIKRLFAALKKSDEVVKEENYVELASIGINPIYKNKKIGTQLINSLTQQINFSKYKFISLETDADNNEMANHFYKKNGFILYRQYYTNPKRKMNEYRYLPK